MSDDASPGLRHVRRSMKTTQDRIHTQLNSILNSSRSYLQEAVITMRDGRYCLPVKAEYKNQVAGMVHDQSSTGSTLFIEPMAIIRLNNDLRTLEIQEQKEIEAVLADLSNQLAPLSGGAAVGPGHPHPPGFCIREGGPVQTLQVQRPGVQPEPLHQYQGRPPSPPGSGEGGSHQYPSGKRI